LRIETRRLPGYTRLHHYVRAALPPHEHQWYAPELIDKLPLPSSVASGASLNAALVRAVEHQPLPLYLRVEDRNSMAHSVEVRLPFLDYRLVSLAFTLPSRWKLHGRWNKYVVREAMRGVIAESVRTRLDKMGFPTPGRHWFAGPWYEPARDLLASRRLRESGICNVEAVQKDLEQHRAGAIDVATRLFQLAEFGVWLDAPRSVAPRSTSGKA
jgi:asparagine synthase (glutamine-hydrolysing)